MRASAFKERLQGARYLITDLVYMTRYAFRRVGRSARDRWFSLSLEARRGIAITLAAVAAIALFVVLAVPSLPCGFPGGDRCPPSDDADELVPRTAVAYLHANVDPDTEQYENLTAVAEDLPLISRQIFARALGLAPGGEEGPAEFRRDLEPWFAGEAAIAIVRGPGEELERVTLLEVDDSDAATRYARDLAAGEAAEESYRSVAIATDERGVATAEVEGFLVVGTASGVRAIVDAATGARGAESLAGDPEADDVRDELPDHRFAEAWIARRGTGLVAGDSAFGFLTPFVSPGATRGVAIALSAGDDSIELAVRSALDPEREQRGLGFFAAFPEFEPSLPDDLSAEALAYLGIGEPGRTVRALLRQAATEAPGIAGGCEALVDRLREQGGIDLEKRLLPALGDEAAFAIEPSRGDNTGPGGLPYLEFVARGVDEERARRALAGLQRPLAEAFDPGSAVQAPVFGESDVAGVEVRSVRVSPTVELSYAVFDGLAVVATSPAGIEQLADGDGGLDSADAYERATDGFEDEVSLLAFLDLRELIAEGFEIGLAEVPAFVTFAEELRRLEALGLQVRRDDDLLATDARLLVTR